MTQELYGIKNKVKCTRNWREVRKNISRMEKAWY